MNDNLTWFRVDQNTDAEQLFNFLMNYVPMGQVLKLYKRIKQEIEG